MFYWSTCLLSHQPWMFKRDTIYITSFNITIILLIISVVEHSTYFVKCSKDILKIINNRKKSSSKGWLHNHPSWKDTYFHLICVSVASALVYTKHPYLLLISRIHLAQEKALLLITILDPLNVEDSCVTKAECRVIGSGTRIYP